jgi:hypothetical protein
MRVLAVQERNTSNVTEKKVNNKKGANWLLFFILLELPPTWQRVHLIAFSK